MGSRVGPCRMYGRKVPRHILETRCMAEWCKVYGILEPVTLEMLPYTRRLRVHIAFSLRTSVWTRLRRSYIGLGPRMPRALTGSHRSVDACAGTWIIAACACAWMRRRRSTQHIYASIFFKPLGSYSRTQRLTVTFTILIGSMAGACLHASALACSLVVCEQSCLAV